MNNTNTKQKVSEYEQQALNFLAETKTEFNAVRVAFGKYFEDDKEERDIYRVSLVRKDRKPMIFNFGQSIVNSGTLDANHKLSEKFMRSGKMFPKNPEDFECKRKAPTAYDVLACLQKYDVGTFEDFCSEFGYDQDSRKAEKIYLSVVKEYNSLRALYSEEEMEKLREIQ